MYAVIEAGGKQYRVEVGTELEVDLIDAAPGDSLAIERVLLVADGDSASIGRPTVDNASVAAEVLGRERGEKVISFKYRPKARRRVKKGHRQELTRIRISDIVVDGKSAAGERAKADEARKTERMRLEEAARKQAEQDAALAAKLATGKLETARPAGKSKDEAGTKAAPKAPARGRATAKAETKAAKAAKSETKAGTKATEADSTAATAAKAETKRAPAKPRAKATGTTAKASKPADTSDSGKTAAKPAAKPRRARKPVADEPTE